MNSSASLFTLTEVDIFASLVMMAAEVFRTACKKVCYLLYWVQLFLTFLTISFLTIYDWHLVTIRQDVEL